jgi:hypothetical protein
MVRKPKENYKEGGLIAPNGKKSNLTQEQYELVRTPKFKAWFGDWENDAQNASKVIDENGEPKVVYHGTYVETEFNIFDFYKADLGFHFGTYEQAKNRLSTKRKQEGYKSIIKPYFLNIRHITEINDHTEFEYPQRYVYDLMDEKLITELEFRKNDFANAFYKEDNKKIRDFLIEKYGNKIGFIYNNKYEGEGYSYIVLVPNQIKLADGTNTTFDFNNPDIRYLEGGNLGEEITCSNCGWEWNTADSEGKYKYICNKCGQINNMDNKNNNYMKIGGELNPDNKETKEYYSHKSGNVGGMLVGNRHSEGGIKATNKSNGQPIEMEGGEVVITRNAVSDNTKREFNGQMLTNKQILSKINQSGGGVSFEDGGELPENIMVSGKEYSYGGKVMKDHEIVSSCGCKHSMADGGEVNDRQAYYATLSNKSYEHGGELDTDDFNDTEKNVLNHLKRSIHGLIKIDREHCNELEHIQKKGIVYITQSDSHGCKDVKLTDYGIEVVRQMGDMQFKKGGEVGCMECGCKEYKKGGTTDENTKYYKGTKHEYNNQFEINKAIEELITDIEAKDLTPEEKQFVSYYAGYGGLEKFGAKGKGLLYEYFTPSEIAKKMWGLAYKHGFKGGLILEPSCGIGEFIKYAPEQNMVTGYEINDFSAKICKILYPMATIQSKYFETLFIKNNSSIRDKTEGMNKYSLIIGNPPYGSMGGIYAGLGEKSYTKANNYIDYFIFRGLDLLQSDGLLIYIIGTEVAAGGVPFLQQGMNAFKENITKKADIVDAYRLPNGLFETTDVLTDIIVFKKR